MTRQEWARFRADLRRRQRTCEDKGHIVSRSGPYLICRELRCERLVVGIVE